MEQGRTDCERLRALLPAYSIGALNADEAREAERLLARCPELADDARAYARLARALSAAAPPQPPPASLREQILRAAAQTSAPPTPEPVLFAAAAHVNAAAPVRPRQMGRRPLLSLVAWAAALALLIVSNGYWLAQVEALRRDAAQRDATLALIAAPDARSVKLMSTDGVMAYARVSWMPGAAVAVLSCEDLPPLPPDQTYQIWLIGQEGDSVSAGVFRVEPNGETLLILEPTAPIENFNAIGISTEPVGGSDAPTTAPMAFGAL